MQRRGHFTHVPLAIDSSQSRGVAQPGQRRARLAPPVHFLQPVLGSAARQEVAHESEPEIVRERIRSGNERDDAREAERMPSIIVDRPRAAASPAPSSWPARRSRRQGKKASPLTASAASRAAATRPCARRSSTTSRASGDRSSLWADRGFAAHRFGAPARCGPQPLSSGAAWRRCGPIQPALRGWWPLPARGVHSTTRTGHDPPG